MSKTAYDHPNFVALRQGTYQFRGFLGNEPRPELPTGLYRDPDLTDKDRTEIVSQYAAAERLWAQARYRRTVKPLIQPAVTAWRKYKAATTIMDDIYAGFWNESDGGWQARIMRLLDARAVAIDAAGEYENNHARDLAVALNDQQNVWDRYLEWGWLRLSDVAQEMGIDIGDMNPGSATADDWRSCGPALVDELQQTIREQDRKLRQVKDLSGGASW